MANAQEKTLAALQHAIQMEIDGKEYYLKAGQKSSNEMGKKLLQSLSAEEDLHRKNFEEIYEDIRSKKAWPKVAFQPDDGKGLRTIFAQATEEPGFNKKAAETELDTIQGALDMEAKSYDFYQKQSKDAVYDMERDFYEALASQERQHQLVLLDYYEYLKDPAAWFVQKEHPSLDGG